MQITRRRALLGIASIPATATAVAAAPPVHPIERLHALHYEVSALMAAYNEFMGGKWELRIRAEDDRFPVIYRKITEPRNDYLFAEILHEWAKLTGDEKRTALDILKAVQS